MRRIVFTGGGTAGHVIPNLVLMEYLQKLGYQVDYIGSQQGIERDLVQRANFRYFAVTTGKLRRYFTWRNFLMPFQVLRGCYEAWRLLRELRPQVIFSKGGFVAVPVVLAAWYLKIPIIIHEADLTLGLANRLALPFATYLCVSFAETRVPARYTSKVVLTGLPLREQFWHADPQRGRNFCVNQENRKILLICGGSSGSMRVNEVVRAILPYLLQDYFVVHICGEGKIDPALNYSGYQQYEYLHEEFPDVLAAADLVITRAGANILAELIALQKPSLLLPLSHRASRGDQELNAANWVKHGWGAQLLDDNLTTENLILAVQQVEQQAESYRIRLADARQHVCEATTHIVALIGSLLSSEK